MNIGPRGIGIALSKAARLDIEPLCVLSSKELPEGSVPLTSIHGCVARAIYTLARKRGPIAYIDESSLKGCCPGGQSWLGYRPFSPKLKHFISQGAEDFRGGRAEFLKRNPEMVDHSWRNIGNIVPLEGHLVVAPCHMVETEAVSIIVLGSAEQIRNISSLVHFGTDDVFGAVIAPWGPACAQMVTYAAGMAERSPRESASLGSMDPTVNSWFPRDEMFVSIPYKVAKRMFEDLDSSFLVRNPGVAMPECRDRI